MTRNEQLGEIIRLACLVEHDRVGHFYVSTACQHYRHNECRRVCKFCPSMCLCPCHKTEANT